VQVLFHLDSEVIEQVLLCAVVVQRHQSILFGNHSHLFCEDDFVVWSKQVWNFVLVDKVVHIFKHEAKLQLGVSQQESSFFAITANQV
jgi:hypothetical protein